MRNEITQTTTPIRWGSSLVPLTSLSPQPSPFPTHRRQCTHCHRAISSPALPHHPAFLSPPSLSLSPRPSPSSSFPIASKPLPIPRPSPSARATHATHRRRVWSAGGRGAAAPHESCRASGRSLLCFPFSCGRGCPSRRRRTRCGGGDPTGPPGHTRPSLGAPSSAHPSTPPEAPWCVRGVLLGRRAGEEPRLRGRRSTGRGEGESLPTQKWNRKDENPGGKTGSSVSSAKSFPLGPPPAAPQSPKSSASSSSPSFEQRLVWV